MHRLLTVVISIAVLAVTIAHAGDLSEKVPTIVVRSIRSDVQDVHARPDAKFIDRNFSFYYRMEASRRDSSAEAVMFQLSNELLGAELQTNRPELEYFPFATIEVSTRPGPRKFVTDGCYVQDLATKQVSVLGERWRGLIGTLSAPLFVGSVDCP